MKHLLVFGLLTLLMSCKPPLQAGDIVQLGNTGGSRVFVASNSVCYDLLERSLTATDIPGVQKLEATGCVYRLNAGTRARVIEQSGDRLLLRIMGGSYDAESVYCSIVEVTSK